MCDAAGRKRGEEVLERDGNIFSQRDASVFPPRGSPGFSTVPIPISIHFSQRTRRAQRSLGDSTGGFICVHLRHLRLKIRNFHGMENVFSIRRNRTEGVAEACSGQRHLNPSIHLTQEAQGAQKERKRRSEQRCCRYDIHKVNTVMLREMGRGDRL
jgi:hypothetical protein